jgi:hypothetical protein
MQKNKERQRQTQSLPDTHGILPFHHMSSIKS